MNDVALMAAAVAQSPLALARSWALAVQANGGTVSEARYRLVADLIGRYKACGWWDRMDDAALLVAENAGQALTTLKRRQLMTVGDAPTFTADAGYAFDGVNDYIDTGWIASSHAVRMTGTDARVGLYERTNVAAATQAIGATSGGQLQMRPRTNTSILFGRPLAAAGNYPDAVTDSRGLTVIAKVGNSTTILGWKNGVAVTPVTVASVNTALPTISLFIGASNSAGSPSGPRASTIGYADWGAPLSATQELAVYTALQAFMTAVGANV